MSAVMQQVCRRMLDDTVAAYIYNVFTANGVWLYAAGTP